MRPVRYALDYYRRLNEAAKDERHRKSVIDLGESGTSTPGTGSSSVVKSGSSHSMRSKRSGCTIRSRSRSIDDETENAMLEESEQLESSDPETATEVEVSEKTLKFKISTEGNMGSSSAGRKSYPGSRKGSREKSSLDYHNHDLAKAVRDHDRERRKSRGENLSSDMSSPVSARSGEDTRILEEFEKDEILCVDPRYRDERPEGNGNIVVETTITERNNSNKRASIADSGERIGRKEIVVVTDSNLRCCCDDKSTSNNHKSLLSRLRNFTDRLSISFDSKDPPVTKPTRHHVVTKTLTKSNSVMSSGTSRQNSTLTICKRCNLVKNINTSKEGQVVALTGLEKRAMTLPKARKSHDSRTKSWRLVFAKEKRPSASLEALPAHDTEMSAVKHKRNLSNPEGKVAVSKTQSLKDGIEQKRLNFSEIDIRTKSKPEILVHPGSSNIVDEDIEKVEIRRSSASMEDISKITKQNEGILLGTLDDKKSEEMQQHTGSLDSMLYKESTKTAAKKSFVFSSPCSTKKSTPSLFSRFKSGMSIDGRSNSGSLNDQSTQQQSQSGWISTLTASFRPKRHAGDLTASMHSPGHEEIK